MADREFHYLMRRHEFIERLLRVVPAEHLWIVKEYSYSTALGRKPPLVLVAPYDVVAECRAEEPGVFRYFVTYNPVSTVGWFEPTWIPAMLGLVVCELPKEDGDTLCAAWMTARCHWWEESTGAKLTNPECLKLFKTLRKYMVKEMQTGVSWPRRPGRLERDRSLWYSPGARAWFESGKYLHVYGGSGPFYVIDPPGIAG